MKQTLLTRLVLGAIAGIAVTSAFAGQIQSSSVAIAREVITDDLEAINAPAASYRFAGDVDARIQTQTFQVQLLLKGGAKWTTVGTAAGIVVTDGVDGIAWTQNVVPGAKTYQVIGIDKGTTSTTDDTLWVTFQVDTVGAKAVLKQPIITLNGAATVSTISNLYTDIVKPVVACDTAVKNLAVTFKHFTGLANPNALATAATATEDEHKRANAQNDGTLITFPTNIAVVVTKSTGDAKVDVNAANKLFAGTTGPAYISTTLTNLGTIALSQQATGYDVDLTNQYLLNKGPGLDEKGTATLANGVVEPTNIAVKITAPQGFVVGSTVALNTAANCAVGTIVSSALIGAANATNLTLTVPNTINQLGMGASGAGPLHVCYDVTGVTLPIPLTTFDATATLNKAPGAIGVTEQNNSCSGTLYPLGGGVKIDVRNYASSKETSGYSSVIRLINNSESRTIDVYGQIIHQDGTYGAWGKLADLAPRAILNMTAAQIDAKLVTAPNSAANGVNAPVAAASGAPRLRITSNLGSTLRVQNYLFNSVTGQILEASGAQGVDFEGNTDRAPVNEGQYQSQDAFKGIDGK